METSPPPANAAQRSVRWLPGSTVTTAAADRRAYDRLSASDAEVLIALFCAKMETMDRTNVKGTDPDEADEGLTSSQVCEFGSPYVLREKMGDELFSARKELLPK